MRTADLTGARPPKRAGATSRRLGPVELRPDSRSVDELAESRANARTDDRRRDDAHR